MDKVATQALEQNRSLEFARQAALVVGASLFVALCSRVTVALPFTPVPLTLANFAVLAVGLTLGARRGFAALVLYLAEGAMGLPVFAPSPLGGGIAQILGPTGGFLMAYPFVAFVAGWIYEHSSRKFGWAALAGLGGEIVLFAGGLGWLFALTHSASQAIRWGLYWFLFAEVIKIMMAAGVAERGRKWLSPRS
jgi:biotin transport system substrate-specific component